MRIQAFLTAAAVNLKRLAAALAAILFALLAAMRSLLPRGAAGPVPPRPARGARAVLG
jgi:hypothetical protein